MPTYEFNPLTREFDITGGDDSGLSVPIQISQGGTGQTGAAAAINALTQASSAADYTVLQNFSSSATLGLPRIPEVTSDPSNPAPGQMWVLRADTGGDEGTPLGMLVALTQTVGATTSYTLKFKTSGGAIVSEVLT